MPEYDDFVHSSTLYSVKELVDLYSSKLPIIVIARECPPPTFDDMHTYTTDEIFRLDILKTQPRLVARDERGHKYSIPKDCQTYMQPIYMDGTVGNSEPLKTIISNWIKTKPIEKLRLKLKTSLKVSYSVETGISEKDAGQLRVLTCESIYDEKYLAGFAIIEDTIPYHPSIIPMYVSTKFALITGMKKSGKEQFRKYLTSIVPDMKENLKLIATNGQIFTFPANRIIDDDEYATIEPTGYIYSATSSTRDCYYGDSYNRTPRYIGADRNLKILSKEEEERIRKERENGPPIPPKGKAPLYKQPLPDPVERRSLPPVPDVVPSSGSHYKQSYENHYIHQKSPVSALLFKPPAVPNENTSSIIPRKNKPTATKNENAPATLPRNAAMTGGTKQSKRKPPQVPDNESEDSGDEYQYIDGLMPDIPETFKSIVDIPDDISKLSKFQIAECLRFLKMNQHICNFLEADMNGGLLIRMDEEILCKDFKFKKFEARKLLHFCKGWRPL